MPFTVMHSGVQCLGKKAYQKKQKTTTNAHKQTFQTSPIPPKCSLLDTLLVTLPMRLQFLLVIHTVKWSLCKQSKSRTKLQCVSSTSHETVLCFPLSPIPTPLHLHCVCDLQHVISCCLRVISKYFPEMHRCLENLQTYKLYENRVSMLNMIPLFPVTAFWEGHCTGSSCPASRVIVYEFFSILEM